MIDRIQEKMWDLIEADALWSTSSLGSVNRFSDGDTLVSGELNLFDFALSDDSKVARPAIYFGDRVVQGSDRLESQSTGRVVIQHRVASVPITIVTQDANGKTAKDQREEIENIIRAILSKDDNVVLEGYWWLLTEVTSRGWFKNSGGGTAGAYEAGRVLTYEVNYTRRAGATVS